jgi:hypothetical protein
MPSARRRAFTGSSDGFAESASPAAIVDAGHSDVARTPPLRRLLHEENFLHHGEAFSRL